MAAVPGHVVAGDTLQHRGAKKRLAGLGQLRTGFHRETRAGHRWADVVSRHPRWSADPQAALCVHRVLRRDRVRGHGPGDRRGRLRGDGSRIVPLGQAALHGAALGQAEVHRHPTGQGHRRADDPDGYRAGAAAESWRQLVHRGHRRRHRGDPPRLHEAGDRVRDGDGRAGRLDHRSL